MGRRVPAGEGWRAGSGVAERAAAAPGVLVASLDAVVLVCELLVIEAELIHEGGRHLLDLVLGESLGETASRAGLSLQELPQS